MMSMMHWVRTRMVYRVRCRMMQSRLMKVMHWGGVVLMMHWGRMVFVMHWSRMVLRPMMNWSRVIFRRMSHWVVSFRWSVMSGVSQKG